jgi:hypothetical protein
MVLTEAIFPKPEAASLPLLLLLTTLLAFVLPPSTLCPVDEGLLPSDPALLPALLTDLLLTVLLLGSLKPASVSTAAMPASACKHDSTHHDECMASCTTVSTDVAKLAPRYQSGVLHIHSNQMGLDGCHTMYRARGQTTKASTY